MAILQEANIHLSNLFTKENKNGKLTNSLKILKYNKKQSISKSLKKINNLKNYRQNDFNLVKDYLIMDATYPIIKAALDIYSEEATCENFEGNVITITSTNNKIKDELENLFFKVLKLNYNSHLYIRNTCKYGNTYCYIDVDDINGVKELIYLNNENMLLNINNIDENKINYNYYGHSIEPWQVVHWKNVEDLETYPYGVSVLRSIVETWRRIVLMREAVIIYRITRAPSRYLFKVDTTGMLAEESERFINDVQKETTTQPLIDFKTGTINYAYDSLGIEKNVYLPVDENSQTDVTTLDGASNLDQIEDYKVIKDDLFAGLKIPKSWLTFDEDLQGKSTLSGQDSRFSRTTQKIQRQYIEGLVHIATVHLYHKGYTDEDLENFEIKMYHPNTMLKKDQLEIIKEKIGLFKEVWDKDNEGLNVMSFTEACKSVMDFTDDQIKQMIKQQFDEKKLIKKLKGEDSEEMNQDEFGEEQANENDKKEIDVLPKPRLPKLRLENKTILERFKNKRLW